MVESEAVRSAMHLARSGVFYGSIIEVSLSSIALTCILCFFNSIETKLELADHGWMVMYSTILTTSIMVASGVLGIVTTWSREKVRKSAPLVKKAAFVKAVTEGSLFMYMVAYNIVVAYWICTTPGSSGWSKAIKVLLSAPGMFFQFGWFMACQQFWKELHKGHGEDLVMPEQAVHTFADLSEPLLPEDSSDAEGSARGVFKSASQFGPMGIGGAGPPDGSPPALTNGHGNGPNSPATDVEDPGRDAARNGAAAGNEEEGLYSRYVAPALEFVGLVSPHADESQWVAPGDVYPAGGGPSVSPVLSPSRLRRVDIDAADPNSPSASSTDISDDKENSARGPGDPIIAALAASASPAASTAAPGEEAVLSPSVHSQGSLLHTAPKVPPLVIPAQSPGSPRAAAHPSGQASSYASTPTPTTARPAAVMPSSHSTPPPRAAALVPPLPPLPVASRFPAAPPNSAHTPTPATPRSASARIAALLSARKMISPMKSAGKSASGSVTEAGLPPPSPQSDLSLSRFMNLVKNRKQAAKAAQKLPQHFAGATAQFAVKSARAPSAGASVEGNTAAAGAGASSSQSMPAVSADSLPHLDGRDALSAEATVFQGSGGGWRASPRDEETAAPAGSATTPRWLPGSGTLNTHNFDGSLSSDAEFEDATSEMAPSSTNSASSAAARAADKFFRRSSGGGRSDGGAAFGSGAIGSKVSTVWGKVKARTSSGGRGE
eukprot:jgi/Ulvmu1/5509/UM023_0045.1